MMKMLIFAWLLVLWPLISGQVSVNRTCSSYNISTNNTFNLRNFSGEWYEIAGYSKLGECASGYVAPYQNTTRVTLYHYYKIDNNYKTIQGYVEQKSNNSLLVTLENGTFPVIPLVTDYTSYGAFWSCNPLFNGTSTQYLVILSKTKTTMNQLPHKLERVFLETGISDDKIPLTVVEHGYDHCRNKNPPWPGTSTPGKPSSTIRAVISPIIFILLSLFIFVF